VTYDATVSESKITILWQNKNVLIIIIIIIIIFFMPTGTSFPGA